MVSILIGLLLVFCKNSLSFIEIGGLYYFTNIVGYLLIYNGLTELRSVNRDFLKIQPYVTAMIIHSVLIFILNITGNSLLTVPMSSVGAIIGYLGLVIVVGGMFMVFYIIHRLIEVIKEQVPGVGLVKILNGLSTSLLVVAFFTFISFILNVIPVVAETMMAILLVMKLVFLGFLLTFIVSKKELFA